MGWPHNQIEDGMANKSVLTGNGIEIDRTIGANPEFPRTYVQGGGNMKKFKPAQITTDQSGAGTLVSVALPKMVDTGGTRFGFFLPTVQKT
jgi:hypothetical protein